MTERLFHLSENQTSVRTEILAGVTTFLTMAYIIVVQPAVLSGAMFGKPTGMDFGAVMTATCLSAALFLLALFFSPLIAMVGSYPPITSPALVIVGAMMIQNVAKIDWKDYSGIRARVPDDDRHPAFVFHCGRPGAWLHHLSNHQVFQRQGARSWLAELRACGRAAAVFHFRTKPDGVSLRSACQFRRRR